MPDLHLLLGQQWQQGELPVHRPGLVDGLEVAANVVVVRRLALLELAHVEHRLID